MDLVAVFGFVVYFFGFYCMVYVYVEALKEMIY